MQASEPAVHAEFDGMEIAALAGEDVRAALDRDDAVAEVHVVVFELDGPILVKGVFDTGAQDVTDFGAGA